MRGRRARRGLTAKINAPLRNTWAMVLMLALLGLTLGKLAIVQTVDAAGYRAKAASQQVRTLTLPAQRGSISDRNDTPLAFTVQGRAIAARPALFENDGQRRQVAGILAAALPGQVTVDDVMAKLVSGQSYVYLVRGLMPAQTDEIMAKISPLFGPKQVNAVVTEEQDLREHPGGPADSLIIGSTGWDGHGLSGVETDFDQSLSGTDGSRTVDVAVDGNVIPGTTSKQVDAVNGSSLRLTLDSDLQYTFTQMLGAQVAASKAKLGCGVIKGARDGQIYAMTCTAPGKTPTQIGNMAITTPIEPGSVNKIVTFAAALEKGIIKPDTVLDVNGDIAMGGVVVHDAWPHGPIPMTATGILAKSSNVGTLMIAQKVGPDAFAQELTKYRLGQKTGIELPGESTGYVPPQSTWSASTFANLPIGQGLSMTLLQLADMYQAIANDGVMVAPTIVAGTTTDGTYKPHAAPKTYRVMSAGTAATLRDMLRSTVQHGGLYYHGTAPGAAINGYQVAGKTGTGQQINPVTHAYSNSLVNATFAGIVPADNPRFVITIWLDAPGGGAEGGTNAALVFHQIASYAMREYDVPPSPGPAPVVPLYVLPNG